MIGEYDSRNLSAWRQGNLERVALHVTRNRARNSQTSFCVVATRREDEGRTPPALLVTGLRIEGQPDEIASVWHVRASYHTSSPTRGPQSLSLWRFRGVIFATSSSSE